MVDRNGNGAGTHDDDRRAAIETARSTFADLHEMCEGLEALVDVIEEVGDAVLSVAADGGNEEEQYDAGEEALDPKGDGNDALRAGLRWFVAARSGEEDAPAPTPRRKAKKARSGRS